MNAGCAPERILAAHASDQRADVVRNGWSSGPAVAALPGPEQTEGLAMPGDDGVRFDASRGLIANRARRYTATPREADRMSLISVASLSDAGRPASDGARGSQAEGPCGCETTAWKDATKAENTPRGENRWRKDNSQCINQIGICGNHNGRSTVSWCFATGRFRYCSIAGREYRRAIIYRVETTATDAFHS